MLHNIANPYLIWVLTYRISHDTIFISIYTYRGDKVMIKSNMFKFLRKYHKTKASSEFKLKPTTEILDIPFIYNSSDVYALVRQEHTQIRGHQCSCSHMDYFYIADTTSNSAKAIKLTGKKMGEIYDCAIEHKINEAREADCVITINTDNSSYIGDNLDSEHIHNGKPQYTLSELNSLCIAYNTSYKSKDQDDVLPSRPERITRNRFIKDHDKIHRHIIGKFKIDQERKNTLRQRERVSQTYHLVISTEKDSYSSEK